MRKKLLGLAVAGAFLVPSAASAAVLSYGGVLILQLATLPGITINGIGGALVNGSGGGGHLSALNLAAAGGGLGFGPQNASLPVTSSATVNSVRFTSVRNLTGAFAGGSTTGTLAGQMGLGGLAKICLGLAPCPFANVPVPLTPVLGVGLGVGGTQNVKGAVNITLQHNGWTTGLAAVTIHDTASTTGQKPPPTTNAPPGTTIHATGTNTLAPIQGFVHGGASGTSSTAANSGVVQLVTATKAFTSLTAAFPELPLFGVMVLHFVPEPGTLMLLGAGVLGLAAFGRKKMRK